MKGSDLIKLVCFNASDRLSMREDLFSFYLISNHRRHVQRITWLYCKTSDKLILVAYKTLLRGFDQVIHKRSAAIKTR